MATSKNPATSARQTDYPSSFSLASLSEDMPFVPAFDLLPKDLQLEVSGSQELLAGELSATDIAVLGAALWEASIQGQNCSPTLPAASHGSRWLLAARIGGVSNRY
jgi:hypothetical protein